MFAASRRCTFYFCCSLNDEGGSARTIRLYKTRQQSAVSRRLASFVSSVRVRLVGLCCFAVIVVAELRGVLEMTIAATRIIIAGCTLEACVEQISGGAGAPFVLFFCLPRNTGRSLVQPF